MQLMTPPLAGPPRPPLAVLRGVNVDPLNMQTGAQPDPNWLMAQHFNAVRLVSRHDPRVETYAEACVNAGLFVLAAITAESQGNLIDNAHLYQLRNEIDIASPSSEGVIDPATYAQEVALYCGTYPDRQFLLGSLAAGDPQAGYLTSVLGELKTVLGGADLPNLVGISLHPYAKTLSPARDLVNAHTAAARAAWGRPLPAHVTEWNRPVSEIPGFDWWLRNGLNGGFGYWFCADDDMVGGFGLTTVGRPKPELAAFRAFNANPPAPPAPPVAAYEPSLVTSDYLSPWDNGAYPAPPQGFLLHGSRSGAAGNTTLEEFWGTAHFTRARQDGLAYTATVGDDMVSWGLPVAHWGWHARLASTHLLGCEFAQPIEGVPIGDGQVRAFCWVVRQARTVWPQIPLRFLTHAEVDGDRTPGIPYGKFDGKSDCAPYQDPMADELRQRIVAELTRQGVNS
jgi:hypothetical protein